jgi:hypothetical protein
MSVSFAATSLRGLARAQSMLTIARAKGYR